MALKFFMLLCSKAVLGLLSVQVASPGLGCLRTSAGHPYSDLSRSPSMLSGSPITCFHLLSYLQGLYIDL